MILDAQEFLGEPPDSQGCKADVQASIVDRVKGNILALADAAHADPVRRPSHPAVERDVSVLDIRRVFEGR